MPMQVPVVWVLAHSGGNSHKDANAHMFWMDGFHQGQGTKEGKSGFGKNKSIECIRRVLDRMRALSKFINFMGVKLQF